MDHSDVARKGGENSRKNLSAVQKRYLGKKAARARWEKYYREHPEKRKKKAKKRAAA